MYEKELINFFHFLILNESNIYINIVQYKLIFMYQKELINFNFIKNHSNEQIFPQKTDEQFQVKKVKNDIPKIYRKIVSIENR